MTGLSTVPQKAEALGTDSDAAETRRASSDDSMLRVLDTRAETPRKAAETDEMTKRAEAPETDREEAKADSIPSSAIDNADQARDVMVRVTLVRNVARGDSHTTTMVATRASATRAIPRLGIQVKSEFTAAESTMFSDASAMAASIFSPNDNCWLKFFSSLFDALRLHANV